MTTTASRRLRHIGLLLVASSFIAAMIAAVLYARFGHEFDWVKFPVPIVGALGFWLGISCYLIGRFQRRP